MLNKFSKKVRILKEMPQIDNSPHTAVEIIKKLAGSSDWKPITVKTLLSRLVNLKGTDIIPLNDGREYNELVEDKDNK